jgi:hypothetical protein
MDRALPEHVAAPVTPAVGTFIFMIESKGGNFAPIINAPDERTAWRKLVHEYQLSGVQSIEVSREA